MGLKKNHKNVHKPCFIEYKWDFESVDPKMCKPAQAEAFQLFKTVQKQVLVPRKYVNLRTGKLFKSSKNNSKKVLVKNVQKTVFSEKKGVHGQCSGCCDLAWTMFTKQLNPVCVQRVMDLACCGMESMLLCS